MKKPITGGILALTFIALFIVFVLLSPSGAITIQGGFGSSIQGGSTKMQGDNGELPPGGSILRNDGSKILRNDSSDILRN